MPLVLSGKLFMGLYSINPLVTSFVALVILILVSVGMIRKINSPDAKKSEIIRWVALFIAVLLFASVAFYFLFFMSF